jgi:hypothetical protein
MAVHLTYYSHTSESNSFISNSLGKLCLPLKTRGCNFSYEQKIK